MLVAIGAAVGAAVPLAVVMVPGAVWYEVRAEDVGVPDRCLWLGWRLLSLGKRKSATVRGRSCLRRGAEWARRHALPG